MALAAHSLRSDLSPMKMEPGTLPLSPTASSHGGQMPQGFDDLVHHNAATSYPREQTSGEHHSFLTSPQADSRMSTPAPHAMSPHFSPYGLPLQQQEAVYANDYAYQSQAKYNGHDGGYPSMPEEHQPAYTTPESSPSQRSDMISQSHGSPPRPATTPRPLASKSRVQKPKKRKGRAKADKDKVQLEKPLSEMSEDWKQSMIEIEEYINRPAEVRRKEIEMDRKQPGRIKRPMNSFMLYRKAFQNHTKAYCEHNNHQVVSRVCGASWDQEPEHIRKQFGDWAKLERANHQKAHPGYKFSPAKPKTASKRKSDSDDEASDLEPMDWDGRPIKMARSSTGTPAPEHESMYPAHQNFYLSPQQYGHQPVGPHPGVMAGRAMMSSYAVLNPNKAMPTPYGQIAMPSSGQYLSSNTNRNLQRNGYVEDISYSKAHSPGVPYQQSLQPSLMAPYVSPPQTRSLEHTSPAGPYMQHGQLDSGMFPMVHDAPFDPNDPLHLPDHTIEASGLNFNFGDAGMTQQMGDALGGSFGESMLQDQQAQQLLRGNNESWDIQPLEEGQAGDQFDDWRVDPSLSQPYSHDPPLSEAYNTGD